jgi:hypothetical protein
VTETLHIGILFSNYRKSEITSKGRLRKAPHLYRCKIRISSDYSSNYVGKKTVIYLKHLEKKRINKKQQNSVPCEIILQK